MSEEGSEKESEHQGNDKLGLQFKEKVGVQERIANIFGPIGGFISAIMLAASFYNELRGDRTLGYFFVGGSLLVLIIALGVVGYSKRPPILGELDATDERNTRGVPIYPRFYKLARIGFFLTLAGSVAVGALLFQKNKTEQAQAAQNMAKSTQQTMATATQQAFLANKDQIIKTQATQQAIATASQQALENEQALQAREEKLIIVIAAFDGPEDKYGMRNQLIEELNTKFSSDESIEIIPIDEVVTSLQGSEVARLLGESQQADLVIWAWYKPTENPNITIHIENLSTESLDFMEDSKTYNPNATISELESFEVQRQLGAETSTLISFVTGVLAYNEDNYKKAIPLFESILEEQDTLTYINPVVVYTYLGASQSIAGEYRSAIENFNTALKIDPQYARAYLQRGIAYTNLYNDELGLTTYTYLHEDELGLQDLDKAIQLDKSLSWANAIRGFNYYLRGDYENALKNLSTALRMYPSYPWAYSVRCNIYYEQKKYELALEDCDEAIWLSPESLYARNLRSEIYIAQGLLPFDLNELSNIDPSNTEIHARIGDYYGLMGEYQKSIEEYNKALSADPNLAWGYAGRGFAYVELGEFDKALVEYDQSLKLNPNFPWAYLGHGDILVGKGQYELAFQEYDKALELNPDYDWAYYGRGKAYAGLGQFENAIQEYEHAFSLGGFVSHFAWFYQDRAEVYKALGKTAEAEADLLTYQQLIENNKKFP